MTEFSIDESILNELMQLNTQADPNFVANLVDRFESLAAEKLAEIKNALQKNDRETLFKLAHSLKGSGANLGAASLSSLCKNLQSQSREGDPDVLNDLVQKLEAGLPGTLSALRDFIRSASQ